MTAKLKKRKERTFSSYIKAYLQEKPSLKCCSQNNKDIEKVKTQNNKKNRKNRHAHKRR